MDNKEIATPEGFTMDENGDLIVKRSDTQGMIETRVKTALITLKGEKNPRDICYKSYLNVCKAIKEAGNDVDKRTMNIRIPEIDLIVRLDQIIKMETVEKSVRVEKDYSKLPTSIMYFKYEKYPYHKNLTIDHRLRRSWLGNDCVERDMEPYFMAECHYSTEKDENGKDVSCYDTNFDHMKKVYLMVPPTEEGYPYAVAGVFEYGVQKI